VLFRGVLVYFFGWGALLSLYLSELSWCLPFHPLSAMFVTNHKSEVGDGGECVPTHSVRYGKWYDLLSLNTSLHKEHHDWPSVPFHKLGDVVEDAVLEREGGKSWWWEDVKDAFERGERMYACGQEQ